MLPDKQEDIFKQWIDDHKGLILKIVRANAVDPADQSDLFQEIAFQVWKSIPSFQERSKVSTWIYKVALNTTMVWRRDEKKHRYGRQPLDVARGRECPGENPSEATARREKLEWLYAEIRRLPKADRSLVLLYLDDLSYQEIADILGISVGNVGVKLTRLRRALGDSYAARAK